MSLGDLIKRMRDYLGFERYTIECPGLSNPNGTGYAVEPHETTVWSRGPPPEGTHCLTCNLARSSTSINPGVYLES